VGLQLGVKLFGHALHDAGCLVDFFADNKKLVLH
jgi:hypothetical protein